MTHYLRRFVGSAVVAALCALPASAVRSAPAVCGPEALGTARTIEIGPQAQPLGLQSYPRTLDLRDHEVVLTFDDGPAAPTGKVLDALAAECVRATFFLIGHNAEASPALVKREVAEGHSVGHHSYSHPAATLRGLSEAAARADIDKGIAADDKAAYGAAGVEPRVPFFRFPGFADTPALLAELEQRKITVFGSDIWASDWKTMTPQAELALVMSRLEAAGRGIVLFHDSKAQTAQMLPDLLQALKRHGYSVVHIVPGDGPTPTRAAGPGWTSTTEPIIARTLGGKVQAAPRATPPKDDGM